MFIEGGVQNTGEKNPRVGYMGLDAIFFSVLNKFLEGQNDGLTIRVLSFT